MTDYRLYHLAVSGPQETPICVLIISDNLLPSFLTDDPKKNDLFALSSLGFVRVSTLLERDISTHSDFIFSSLFEDSFPIETIPFRIIAPWNFVSPVAEFRRALDSLRSSIQANPQSDSSDARIVSFESLVRADLIVSGPAPPAPLFYHHHSSSSQNHLSSTLWERIQAHSLPTTPSSPFDLIRHYFTALRSEWSGLYTYSPPTPSSSSTSTSTQIQVAFVDTRIRVGNLSENTVSKLCPGATDVELDPSMPLVRICRDAFRSKEYDLEKIEEVLLKEQRSRENENEGEGEREGEYDIDGLVESQFYVLPLYLTPSLQFPEYFSKIFKNLKKSSECLIKLTNFNLLTLQQFQKEFSITQFNDTNILLRALTQPTFASLFNEIKSIQSNDRLEFLGDSILGSIVSSELFRDLSPLTSMVSLQRLHETIVSNAVLEKIGRNDMRLVEDYMLVDDGHREHLVQFSQKTYADAVEAIIGAIFIDQGWDVSSAFIRRIFSDFSDFFPKREQLLPPLYKVLQNWAILPHEQDRLGRFLHCFDIPVSEVDNCQLYLLALRSRQSRLRGPTIEEKYIPVFNHDRLYYLGMQCLRAIMSHSLYCRFPDHPASDLSYTRQVRLEREYLANKVEFLGLERFGPRAVFASRIVIALVGAIFLDQGGLCFSECDPDELDVKWDFVHRVFLYAKEDDFIEIQSEVLQLQLELKQDANGCFPKYQKEEFRGVYDQVKVRVYHNDLFMGIGVGPTFNDARKDAALNALRNLERERRNLATVRPSVEPYSHVPEETEGEGEQPPFEWEWNSRCLVVKEFEGQRPDLHQLVVRVVGSKAGPTRINTHSHGWFYVNFSSTKNCSDALFRLTKENDVPEFWPKTSGNTTTRELLLSPMPEWNSIQLRRRLTKMGLLTEIFRITRFKWGETPDWARVEMSEKGASYLLSIRDFAWSEEEIGDGEWCRDIGRNRGVTFVADFRNPRNPQLSNPTSNVPRSGPYAPRPADSSRPQRRPKHRSKGFFMNLARQSTLPYLQYNFDNYEIDSEWPARLFHAGVTASPNSAEIRFMAEHLRKYVMAWNDEETDRLDFKAWFRDPSRGVTITWAPTSRHQHLQPSFLSNAVRNLLNPSQPYTLILDVHFLRHAYNFPWVCGPELPAFVQFLRDVFRGLLDLNDQQGFHIERIIVVSVGRFDVVTDVSGRRSTPPRSITALRFRYLSQWFAFGSDAPNPMLLPSPDDLGLLFEEICSSNELFEHQFSDGSTLPRVIQLACSINDDNSNQSRPVILGSTNDYVVNRQLYDRQIPVLWFMSGSSPRCMLSTQLRLVLIKQNLLVEDTNLLPSSVSEFIPEKIDHLFSRYEQQVAFSFLEGRPSVTDCLYGIHLPLNASPSELGANWNGFDLPVLCHVRRRYWEYIFAVFSLLPSNSTNFREGDDAIDRLERAPMLVAQEDDLHVMLHLLVSDKGPQHKIDMQLYQGLDEVELDEFVSNLRNWNPKQRFRYIWLGELNPTEASDDSLYDPIFLAHRMLSRIASLCSPALREGIEVLIRVISDPPQPPSRKELLDFADLEILEQFQEDVPRFFVPSYLYYKILETLSIVAKSCQWREMHQVVRAHIHSVSGRELYKKCWNASYQTPLVLPRRRLIVSNRKGLKRMPFVGQSRRGRGRFGGPGRGHGQGRGRARRRGRGRGRQICRNWQTTGRCRFGDRCRYAHQGGSRGRH